MPMWLFRLIGNFSDLSILRRDGSLGTDVCSLLTWSVIFMDNSGMSQALNNLIKNKPAFHSGTVCHLHALAA